MSDSARDFLAQLAGGSGNAAASWQALQATPARHVQEESDTDEDPRLTALLQRIERLVDKKETTAEPDEETPEEAAREEQLESSSNAFTPRPPQTLAQTGLTPSDVEALLLKLLLARGDLTGREMAEHIRLPFVLVEPLLWQMKQDQLLVYRGSAPMNDYVYQLTDLGRERARRHASACTYFGAAPVPLRDYIASVEAQGLDRERPSIENLKRAFHDLLISSQMLARLGPAIHAGRGMFLYGAPGNGKTSIAERVTAAFGPSIWVPRAIHVDGEIIRVFDPVIHEELPVPRPKGLLDQSPIDRRWVRIRRPTVVVGGELTMQNLEVTYNRSTGICEAPLQLKSNCGTLVIDDFGRQRMSIDELLNRWIVPLEKGYDFLNLPNGKKVQVPFRQFIVFSTNLEPRDLVDDAFLRRIPYKIEVKDPTEEEFRELFRRECARKGMEYNDEAIDYLIRTHYRPAGRPFRCCHPRDLVRQVIHFCQFHGLPPELKPEYLDWAVENYFSVL